MPTTPISIIARTNTIDEWRIQCNKMATDLNDLGFYDYDKTQGTLILSDTSALTITASGTPLQVTNDVLFQSSLTLGNTIFLGIQSTATGNIVAGGTISILGPRKALSVANNAYVGKDLEVVSSVYTGNVYANADVTIGDNLSVDGIVTITSSGTVLSIDDGEASINLVTALTSVSDNARTDNLYAAFARIDVLDTLAFAEITVLENTIANSYYLSSNSHTSNSISTRYITANISGNIVNFSSNVSSINTATILEGNVVTLISETSSINISTTNNATILEGNVVVLVSEDSTINVATINVSSTNDATVLVGNVVTLTANDSTLNVATVNTANITWLTSSNTIYANNIITNNVEVSTINAAYVNVSSDVWLQTGAQLRIYAADVQDEVFTVDGKSTLEETYIRGNIAVEGTWTALGNVEYEVSQFTLNARTPTNADASIRNNRIIGDDAFIRWDETDDQWKVSKGNTYSDLYGILDASFLNATVTSNSTANVATPSAVKAAFETAQFAGGYANNAYVHANNSYAHANNAYANSNAAHTMANAAFGRSNNVYSHANSAYLHANASYIQANTTNAHVYGSITTRIDTLEANTALDAKFREEIVLNSEQNQTTNPSSSMSSSIVVDRGLSTNVDIKWVERQSIDVRVQTGIDPVTEEPVFETQTNSIAGPNWIFTKDGVNYQNVGSDSAESYSNSAYTTANTALVNAELAQGTADDALDLAESNESRINDLTSSSSTTNVKFALNVKGGEENRIVYQTDVDTTNFILAPTEDGTTLTYRDGAWAWEKVASALGGTIDGDLTVLGSVNSEWIEHDATTGEISLNTSKITFNADQNPNQNPSKSAEIEVYRGNSPKAIFRFNETLSGFGGGAWEYTSSGDSSAVQVLGFNSQRANNIAGGATNRIPYQTNTHETAFINAPGVADRYLYWDGSGFTWSSIPLPNLAAATFRADQISSGVFDAARFKGLTDVEMSIKGSAGSATNANYATTAGSVGSATNATNVTDGGNVTTRSIYISYNPQVPTSGLLYASRRVQIAGGGTTSSKNDPSNNAALKVTGDGAFSNDVYATYFRGTATSALYADLAEKYLSDKKYPTGTIMMIGGKKEVTAAKDNKKHAIIGIVSENPAYIMNSDLKNGLMIGLKGRLPVRIVGTCKKGDLISLSDKPGVGTSKGESVILPFRIIALSDKNDEEEGTVEAVII